MGGFGSLIESGNIIICQIFCRNSDGTEDVRTRVLLCDKHKKTPTLTCVGVSHWYVFRRNRRATASLSPVLIHFHSSTSFLYQKLQQLLQDDACSVKHAPVPATPRHPGPTKPRRRIPAEEWPTVLRRVVENQEPLRKVADEYGVSYETIRRIVNTARKRGEAG